MTLAEEFQSIKGASEFGRFEAFGVTTDVYPPFGFYTKGAVLSGGQEVTSAKLCSDGSSQVFFTHDGHAYMESVEPGKPAFYGALNIGSPEYRP